MPEPHHHQLAVVSCYVILNWCVCYLTVGLICTSLITNDIEPLLTRLLSSCISSFVKCLLKYFAYIFIKLIFFL